MASALPALFGHTHSLDIGWTVKGMPFGLCRVGYSFFTGILLYRTYKSKAVTKNFESRRERGYLPLLLIATSTLILMAAPSASLTPYFDLLMVAIIFPIVIYAALWSEPVGMTAKIFKFLGTISYAVYALHSPLGHFVQDYFKKMHDISVENYAPYGGIVLIIGIINLSWLLDFVYDAPIRRYLTTRLKLKPTFGHAPGDRE